LKITVLMGGTSAERDVSLASGVRVAEALRSRGHEVLSVDTAHGILSAPDEQALLSGKVVKTIPPDVQALVRLNAQLPATLRSLPRTEVVFLALHGGQGEDGTLQALLDLTSVPYTGSGHLASALAMDKDLSKHLFRAAGVPTADWRMAPVAGSGRREAGSGDFAAEVERELRLPVIVKPVGEIIPVHEIYDYECKYTAGMAREIFPADLTAEETRTIQDLARRAFRALKLRGYARIDFRMAPDGVFYCLEANTLPGMTALSLIPQAAAAAGMSFPELCERIVQLALEPQGAP
jgi:D-alanine-D-alanine ligase